MCNIDRKKTAGGENFRNLRFRNVLDCNDFSRFTKISRKKCPVLTGQGIKNGAKTGKNRAPC